jgi:acyl carrier protein
MKTGRICGDNRSEIGARALGCGNARDKTLAKVSYDDDLITNRIVDSLRFVELVLYVEELSGRTIDLELLNLSELKTIDAIYESFFT